jgi:hypothetical protein
VATASGAPKSGVRVAVLLRQQQSTAGASKTQREANAKPMQRPALGRPARRETVEIYGSDSILLGQFGSDTVKVNASGHGFSLTLSSAAGVA